MVEPEPKASTFDRRHAGSPKKGDGREAAQVDRDRILYSSALRRLAEVTQVVGAREGHVFHNRLTHTLKVAQLSRRLAEQLRRQYPGRLDQTLLDPEVTEAAALAHDLGHPPFGHIAEKELDRLVKNAGDPDGFEGNAQSFRIVTTLAAHSEEYPGLNLTRRTLNAILKYPWQEGDGPKPGKFGAYRVDEDDFLFARADTEGQHQSLEAAVMDYADSVTYSVHDLFDFYQAGLIPVWEVNDDLPDHLVEFKNGGKIDAGLVDAHQEALENLVALMPGTAFQGSHHERIEARSASSWLINEFVSHVELSEADGQLGVKVPDSVVVRMRFLQNLVWRYVISSSRLASQQVGQVRIIRDLFRLYITSIRGRLPHGLRVLPPAFEAQLTEARQTSGDARRRLNARLAADVVASLTEQQARHLHRRVRGVQLGSVMDHLDP